MGTQQVAKVTETLIAQGVKKLKYVTPTCSELDLNLKTLTCDILQMSPGSKLLKGSLNELCSAHYIDGVEMTKLFEKFPNLDPHLGHLPSSFFQSIEPANIKSKRKELSQFFDKYALKIGSTSVGKEEAESIGNCLQEELSKILNQSLTIELIGNGAWSRCYKICINDKKYALKIFCDDINNYGNIVMGPSVEPGLANLLNEISNKCAKLYCGKVGVENNLGAYTISEFLEGSTPVGISANSTVSDLRKYFWNTNLSNNPNIRITPLDYSYKNLPIGGKFFDYGMFKVEVLNDAEQAFIFHVI